MLLKNFFVDYSTRKMQIENFIRDNFPDENYSKIEMERTPLGVKIIIYTDRPGRIIGAGGKKINGMTEDLKNHFKLENPQIDVRSIPSADLDASIVARKIATALESGYNYKKIGNISIKRTMKAGAIGAEIIISGKLGGSKGRMGKFTDGYLKHCGEPAREMVDYGFKEANTRPGKIGVKVKIMTHAPVLAEDIPEEEKKGVKKNKKKNKETGKGDK